MSAPINNTNPSSEGFSALDDLARILVDAQRGAQIAERFENTLPPTYGTITDVEDPLKQGRVKVTLDETNPEFLNEYNLNQKDSKPTKTQWIEPQVPVKGWQPKANVGKRVPILPKQADPSRLFFGDPVYDPEETSKAAQPQNSSMTRLPVYPPGELPMANEDNIGCMVVEQQGPMDCDWLCVCLKRWDGKYYWVRHMDLNHIHGSQDDGRQPPDSQNAGEAPVEEGVVWDLTRPTTPEPYTQQSYNPQDAGWYGGAQGMEE
jgi:hypothetical protein